MESNSVFQASTNAEIVDGEGAVASDGLLVAYESRVCYEKRALSLYSAFSKLCMCYKTHLFGCFSNRLDCIVSDTFMAAMSILNANERSRART